MSSEHVKYFVLDQEGNRKALPDLDTLTHEEIAQVLEGYDSAYYQADPGSRSLRVAKDLLTDRLMDWKRYMRLE